MAWDSGTSIAWFLNIGRSNVNLPLFQNILMGSFYSLGKLVGNPVVGIAIYCYLQMAIEIWLVAKIVTWEIRKINCKIVLFPLILYFIIPAFPVYAMTMAKDSNFGISILLFEFFAMQFLEAPGEFLNDKGKAISLGG